MAQKPLTRSLLALAAFLMAGGVAIAQSPECQRYRAELASLERGGGRVASGAMEAQRGEIARLSNYYRSIGCDRGPFSFFRGPAPAECGPISQQLRQMEGNYARLAAQANDDGGVEMRRRQLQAAVQQTCSAEQGPRGFFETLFGAPRNPQAGMVPPGTIPGAVPQVPPGALPEETIIDQEPRERSLGGRRLVCVKTCDGSFFPLANAPGGRENADEMCQALCPGTETLAFATSGGEESLNYAVSLSGKPYSSLANAFKFRKIFDESCACKKPNETWAVVLRRAESMLDRKRGDVIVTAEKAEELSRPKAEAPAKGKAAADKKAAAEKAASDAAEAEAAAAAAAAPTASSESSGIGPQSIEGQRVVGQAEGQKRVITTDGSKKTVRVVAPTIIPVPNAPAQAQ